jgi:hypothetical protein
MSDPEKLATYGTQDEENKTKTQYVLDTSYTIRMSLDDPFCCVFRYYYVALPR